MLEALRNAAGTWVAKLLLVVLVVSFAVWGISGQIVTGFGGNAVVTAGGTTVSILDYRLAYDRQLAMLSQQFGQRLTREQAIALGIDEQVLAQLVAGAVLDEQAREMGLGHSRERLGQLAREDPAFAGPDGKFDRFRFEQVLSQIGMTAEDYLRNRQQVAIRQQIVEAVADGLDAPDAFLTAVALHRGEDRTVDYVALPASALAAIADPSAETLAAWFEENKRTYAAPEYRKIAYVKLEAEDIADESTIDDDQVKADYESNIARYTTAETRTIEQIIFASEDAAKTAYESIRAGSTFEEVMAAEGKQPADVLLGTFTRANMPDPAIAEAAFALQANEVSNVIPGTFGPVLIRVTAITPESITPLEDVAAEIRRDLAITEANRILLDVHDAYEDERASGSSMRDSAAKLKLTVVEVEAIDRTARDPAGDVISTLPESQRLLAAAFETDQGIENPPLTTAGGGFVFYEVERITAARDRTLEEVRDRVLADWRAAETDRLMRERADAIQKQVADGATLDVVATELAVEKQTKRGLKRGADDGDFGADGVVDVFRVALNEVGHFASPQGDARIIFKVTEIFEPVGAGPDAIEQAERDSFARGVADDLLDQLVVRLQGEYGVEINRSAIAQALAF
ncbi:MAG: SurA N-terminal domain-containing protein [Rhizobiaceae bacterium]